MSARLAIKPEYREFVKLLDIGNGKYNIGTIFQDLVLLVTMTIKNRYDYIQEDEDIYLRIINKYEKQEQAKFPMLFAKLMMLYMEQTEIKDILGEIYQSIGLSNGRTGQYFTPIHISKLMGETLGINNKKIIKVYDPCCGSGSLILGYVAANKNKIKNFSDKVVFVARDIDFMCVCMTFIQLTMNEISAQVILGNALLDEERKVLYTPEFVKRGWFEKLNNSKKLREEKNNEINI